MPVPLIVWGGVALVSAVGGSVLTLATTDAAEDLGDAAQKVGSAFSKITLYGLLAGTAVIAYQNREQIGAFLKGLKS